MRTDRANSPPRDRPWSAATPAPAAPPFGVQIGPWRRFGVREASVVIQLALLGFDQELPCA